MPSIIPRYLSMGKIEVVDNSPDLIRHRKQMVNFVTAKSLKQDVQVPIKSALQLRFRGHLDIPPELRAA